MKSLSIAKADFDDILYPLIATIPAKGGASELKTVIKILEKLEARSEPASDPTLDDVVGAPALFKLTDDRAKFRFEDAEATIVAERLEQGSKTLSPIRARVIPALIDQLTEADEEPADEGDE